MLFLVYYFSVTIVKELSPYSPSLNGDPTHTLDFRKTPTKGVRKVKVTKEQLQGA